MNKSNDKENMLSYPREIVKLINDQELFGRMNGPTSSAYIKGPCGDEMEFYLVRQISYDRYGSLDWNSG